MVTSLLSLLFAQVGVLPRVAGIDLSQIVSILSIYDQQERREARHGSRTEDPGTRGVLSQDRRRKSFCIVERDGRADHTGAEERLSATSVSLRCDPRLHDRSGQPDHRQRTPTPAAAPPKYP